MVFSGDEVKASNAEAVGMALHSAFIEIDDQILKRAVVRLRISACSPDPASGWRAVAHVRELGLAIM